MIGGTPQMPYDIQERAGEYCVVTSTDGHIVKCHPTREAAATHMKALYANVHDASKEAKVKTFNKQAFMESLVSAGNLDLLPMFKDMWDIDPWDMADRQLEPELVNYGPLLGDNKKACANCQWFILPDDCLLLKDDVSPTGRCDLWHEVISEDQIPDQPIPVQIVNMGMIDNGPNTSVKETDAILAYVKDAIQPWEEYAGYKDVWTTAYVNSLPDSSFAYIDDSGARHLPYKNKDGSVDAAHAKNALARLNQVKGLSGDKASSVKSKLESALKKTDTGDDKKKDFFTKAWRLLTGKASITAPEDDILPVQFFKDNNGNYRYLVRYSNNFRDRDKEIFTGEAHKEYVDWATEKSVYPVARLWHVPDIDIGQCDWVEYDADNGVALASGIIYKEYEGVAENLQKIQSGLGISHGFFPISQKGLLIHQYRPFELSFLPRHSAANVWTDVNLFKEVEVDNAMSVTQVKKDFLKSVGIPDSVIAGLDAGNKELKDALSKLGIDYKAADDTNDNDEDDKPGNANKKKLNDNDTDDASKAKAAAQDAGYIKEAFKSFLDSDEFKASFKDAVDTAVAEAMTPRNNIQVANRPSQNDANVAADGRTKAAKEAQQADNWFTQIMSDVVKAG